MLWIVYRLEANVGRTERWKCANKREAMFLRDTLREMHPENTYVLRWEHADTSNAIVEQRA